MRRKSTRLPTWIIAVVGCSASILILLALLCLPSWYSSYAHATKYKDYDLLMSAIDHQNLEAVKRELDKGINPNTFPNDFLSIQNEDDVAPLCVAVDEDNLEIVKLLLDRGADPNISEAWHGSPMAVAKGHKNQDVMNLLIAHGARDD